MLYPAKRHCMPNEGSPFSWRGHATSLCHFLGVPATLSCTSIACPTQAQQGPSACHRVHKHHPIWGEREKNKELHRLEGRGYFSHGFWLDDYYRSLSCSPLAGFIVDSTKESADGWVPAKPEQSVCAKRKKNKKVNAQSEGSHRHLFSLTPAKPKLTSLFA